MRVTNQMMENNMLLNLNRNMRNLDRLTYQYMTTKKLRVPSDDPILATRILKFQTSMDMVTQYKSNVAQATSWMEISEGAIGSALDALEIIYEKCEEGASDSFNFGDRETLIAQISNLVEEIGYHMNTKYSGRYVFSGYRTNSEEPPVFLESNGRSYRITQKFLKSDIEVTKSYQKFSDTDPVKVVEDVNIMKLAYKGTSMPQIFVDNNDPPTPLRVGTTNVVVVTKPRSNPLNPNDANALTAYEPRYDSTATPAIVEVNFIPETGELVFPPELISSIPKDGLYITYDKTGFEEGELNPKVYFPCEDLASESYRQTGLDTFDKDVEFVYHISETMTVLGAGETPAGSTFQIPPGYNGVKMTYTMDGVTNLDLPGDYTKDDIVITTRANFNPVTAENGKLYFIADEKVLIYGEAMPALAHPPTPSMTVSYDKYGFKAGDANPRFAPGITATEISINPPYKFDMEDQAIEYEFSAGIRIPINSWAMDVYTDKMYADLKSLVELINGIELTPESTLIEYYKSQGKEGAELDEAVKKHMDDETAQVSGVVQKKFSNMLKLINDTHLEKVTTEHTDLGTRMQRLELIKTRLELEYDSYFKLESDANSAEMETVISQYTTAHLVYTASLQASAKISQLSLANFL